MAHFTLYNPDAWLDCFDALVKSIAHSHGRALYGINFDVRGEGTRIILKAYTNGRPEIAFINASTVGRCVELLDYWIKSKSNIGVEWKPDKYYRE